MTFEDWAAQQSWGGTPHDIGPTNYEHCKAAWDRAQIEIVKEIFEEQAKQREQKPNVRSVEAK